MLTDLQVRKAKPGDHADVGGLYLRVSPKGKKVWVLRSQKNGKNTKKAIGVYPGMGLAEARQVSQGKVVATSMADALALYKSKLKVARPEQVEELLRPLESETLTITKVDVVSKLQKIAAKHPVYANRMLTRWKDFFSFCTQQGWIEHNPLEGVFRKFVGGKETPRKRNLSWDEIVGFLNLVLHPDTKLALYFILATGLRPSEALWVLRVKQLTGIPTKTTLHKIPVVPHVRALLKRVVHVPASHCTLSNALRRVGATFRPHDLRRTFASRMADLGVMPHVIEKCLNHQMEGMMAVYNHAEFWDERVAAMKLWGHKLSSLRKKCRGV